MVSDGKNWSTTTRFFVLRMIHGISVAQKILLNCHCTVTLGWSPNCSINCWVYLLSLFPESRPWTADKSVLSSNETNPQLLFSSSNPSLPPTHSRRRYGDLGGCPRVEWGTVLPQPRIQLQVRPRRRLRDQVDDKRRPHRGHAVRPWVVQRSAGAAGGEC